MKKLFLSLAIAALSITAGYAQHTGPKARLSPEEKATKSTAKLEEKLALTAGQKQKVYAIELDKFRKSEDLHQHAKENKQSGKLQHDALKKETDVKLNALLTAEQKKKLADSKAAKKAEKAGKKTKKKGANP